MKPDAPSSTPWECARTLHTEGKTRDDIARALEPYRLDPESLSVLLNALPDGPTPHALPAPNLELRVDPLAPNLLAVSELGLTGTPRTTGVYWLTFGAVLAAIVGLVVALASTQRADEATTSEAAAAWDYAMFTVVPWVGFGVAAVAMGRGAVLWLGAVRLRKK